MSAIRKRGFSRDTHPCYSHKNWKKLRLAKLSAQPLCEICERRGRAVVATTVDHITPLFQGGPWFPSLDKLASLCVRCHTLKTARERGDQHHTRNAYAGTDTHGNPLDPDDPWNAVAPSDG